MLKHTWSYKNPTTCLHKKKENNVEVFKVAATNCNRFYVKFTEKKDKRSDVAEGCRQNKLAVCAYVL